jgi:hypothetical protein
MVYYSAIGRMSAGKWMELENTMLSKVNQARRSNIACFLTYKETKCVINVYTQIHQ